MFKSFLMLGLVLFNTPIFSQEIDPAFTINSVEVYRVNNPELESIIELPKIPLNPIDEVVMYVDGIIAIGKKVWPIIEAGRPVINTAGIQPTINVLPRLDNGVTHAELYDMANWSAPKVVSYRVSYKNLFGNEVIGFTYTIYFQYGGNYQGVGKYITGLAVQASEVYAAWGFNFDASSELVNVANIGSALNPVASAIVRVSYKGRGLNELRNQQSFYVDGNGTMKLLNY
jgi:hypothetical protein